jgi:hypothetical protein
MVITVGTLSAFDSQYVVSTMLSLAEKKLTKDIQA